MEEHFGTILIKKSARRLTLTEFGESLYQRCQRIAEEVQAVSSEALVEQSETQGTLRVSVPSDFGVTWFASLIVDFANQYPHVNMVVRVHNSDLVDLNKEPFDIAIQVGELKRTFRPGMQASGDAKPGYLCQSAIRFAARNSTVDCRLRAGTTGL